jgi:hypothetical protein
MHTTADVVPKFINTLLTLMCLHLLHYSVESTKRFITFMFKSYQVTPTSNQVSNTTAKDVAGNKATPQDSFCMHGLTRESYANSA